MLFVVKVKMFAFWLEIVIIALTSGATVAPHLKPQYRVMSGIFTGTMVANIGKSFLDSGNAFLTTITSPFTFLLNVSNVATSSINSAFQYKLNRYITC